MIREGEFIENEDYKFSPKRAKTPKQGGRLTDGYKLTNHKIGKRSNVIQKDYSLTLDMAKELSMVEN